MTTIGPWAPVMVTIRAETSDDQGAIFDVHAAAFPTAAEARLVNALRAGGMRNEYGVDEEFMVLELQPGARIGASGVVRYGPEFAAVAAG